MSQIIIGFTTEGTTDIRLLESIIERTFVEVGFECSQQVEVMTPVIHIEKLKKMDFIGQVVNACKDAFSVGIMTLCIHVDSDNGDDQGVYDTRINPAMEAVSNLDEADSCKNIIPIVPVQMSEAWMLADKELLKEEIGTNKSDTELGINRAPEAFADPKTAIETAIRIAREGMVKKRRKELDISELYQPIGQKINLVRLEQLPSYVKFKEAVRNAYRALNYMR